MGRFFLRRALIGCMLTALGGGVLLYLSERRHTKTFVYFLSPQVEVLPADLENATKILDGRLETLKREYPIDHWSLSVAKGIEGNAGQIRLEVTGRRHFDEAMEFLPHQGLLGLRLVEATLGEEDSVPEGCVEMFSREERMNLGNIRETLIHRQRYAVRNVAELECSRLANVDYFTEGYQMRTVIKIEFMPDDSRRFAEITEANIGRQLAVVMDGEVQVAPRIQEAITEGTVQLKGIRKRSQARRLADFLRLGALPCSFDVTLQKPSTSGVQ